jgi:hypothetical protein
VVQPAVQLAQVLVVPQQAWVQVHPLVALQVPQLLLPLAVAST